LFFVGAPCTASRGLSAIAELLVQKMFTVRNHCKNSSWPWSSYCRAPWEVTTTDGIGGADISEIHIGRSTRTWSTKNVPLYSGL